MPELSRFYGIIILMYHNDHNPPHFHVRYGGSTTLIGIDPITILRGTTARFRTPARYAVG